MGIPNCWIDLMGFEYYPISYEYINSNHISYKYVFPPKKSSEITNIDESKTINEETTFADNDLVFMTKEGKVKNNEILSERFMYASIYFND